MARVSNALLFRAEAVRLDWTGIAAAMLDGLPKESRHEALDQLSKRVAGHPPQVHLWWACAKDLGVPREPFVVWTRPRTTPKTTAVKVTSIARPEGLLLGFGGREAAVVDVRFDPVDASVPSAVFLFRTAPSLDAAVAAAVAPAGGGPGQTLRLLTSGATSALLVNGTNAKVAVQDLEVVVNDKAWVPLELVGLPVDAPWPGTAYDTGKQGMVAAPLPPFDAAVERLTRGMPLLGWAPVTQAGRAAPPWTDPDPGQLVKEVVTDLLPEIAPMFAGSVAESAQWLMESVRAVQGPTQDGRTSSLDTSATIRPFSLLSLPAQTDVLLNLATGFGTTYPQQSQAAVADLSVREFLVTARYRRPPSPIRAGSTLAAYAPVTGPHRNTPAPTVVRAERSGLVPPAPADTPWRESVRVSWDRVLPSAGLGRVGAGAIARYRLAGGGAESLNPPRDAGGVRPLTISPDGSPTSADFARAAYADGAADIAILSGGRQVGYAVAQVDIHGVWSPWRDVSYVGDEPGPLPPRLISLDLDATYAGSTSCPATLTLEAALDWTERTPTGLQTVAIFYPMSGPADPPPPGLAPSAATPAGCFRRDLSVTFAGDVPTGVGCTVTPMSPDGSTPMSPGPGQGDGGRRYRVALDLPVLDFSGTLRWGVQVWLRSTLLVGASPTAYVPDAAHPGIAAAASPVPVQPLPPPAPPGVPMGSTPDAQGCSHVRVVWSLPGGGAGVRTCVVWECSETALRKRAGLSAAAPDTDSPGVRLAALWAAYDGMTDDQRRAAFRRVEEVDGSVRALDVTLPKGSTDIHLFTVTTQSTTGIESPWPSTPGPAHVHLQAATPPRLRRPAPPLVRAVPGVGGAVTSTLFAASTVPVERFLVFATRSEEAARDRESMGPAVADIPVVLPPGGPDPVMGTPVYQADWSGTLAPSWDPWLVRAVAQPVATVPVQAVRGVPSAASEITSLLVPPDGPPDLDPLTGARWGADHRGVVVTTSTGAPVRVTAAGPHRITGTVDGTTVPIVDLSALPESPGSSPPSGATTAPVFERGSRAAGRSPLRLWVRTPDAGTPCVVRVRMVDPLGRATEREVTVPAWVAPPAYTLTVVGSASASGGIVLAVDTDAPAKAALGLVLQIRAVIGGIGPIGPIGPLPIRDSASVDPPDPPRRTPVPGPTPRPLPTVVSGEFPLAGIPVAKPFFPADGRIHVVALPKSNPPPASRYAVFVPGHTPMRVSLVIAGADGQPIVSTGIKL